MLLMGFLRLELVSPISEDPFRFYSVWIRNWYIGRRKVNDYISES